MRSTFSGIELSKRSLFAQQAALATTGHNIANANTKGYSRQTVNMTAARPLEAVGLTRSTAAGQMGQGVEIQSIARIRQQFLDDQFYGENQNLGDWSIKHDTLDKLEAIVNEPSDTGLTKVMENFWNAWQTVSKDPENLTSRSALKESALAMTDAFNNISKQLTELTKDLTSNLDIKAKEVASYLDQIAGLNQEIYRVEGLGNNANDLRDQRDLLVDNLSKIVNITVTEEDRGYTIKLGTVDLVQGREVQTKVDAQVLEEAKKSGSLKSGEANGILVSRDDYLVKYKSQLNSMVKSLVEGDVTVTLPKGTVIPEGATFGGKTYNGTVEQRTIQEEKGITATVKGLNGLHELGYTLSDPPGSGIPFFTLSGDATEFNAATITVNPKIVSDVSNIAASGRVETVDGKTKLIKGNNDIALALAGLSNEKFKYVPDGTGGPTTNLPDGTIGEFFRSIVGQLGVQSQEARRQLENQMILVDQVETWRQSVSGVSLDEEMANMIKFQHAYSAAARAMTVFDEMLDKVINGMGVVGR
ncbi:flagellar hook-associated protein FlgK [Paenibacillus sp. J31TS4]|uniref:flagellar hook-associated protein FlgK n=1 Tax=Paenibacillus sp. J31TS4 TaxID=2807195 RepID=UPI001B0EC087|nr:flagellar hook-associated protein FlgK [Paenibacillus sp. J31TS4]GIP40984.1 flagellar hook-associated protein FlgK [Paenibacillus sp. J31TS4]